LAHSGARDPTSRLKPQGMSAEKRAPNRPAHESGGPMNQHPSRKRLTNGSPFRPGLV